MADHSENSFELNHSSDDYPEATSWPRIDFAQDAILLDVDGTLLDIAPSPQDVYVPASLLTTLGRLFVIAGGAVALVSGRLITVLDALFEPLKLPAIGCHGAELRPSPRRPDERRSRPLPDSLKRAFADIAHREPQIRVEDKAFTLAFHYRGAQDREAVLLRLLRERIEPFARDYTLLRGKSVVEVKPKTFNKGEALRALLGFTPFAGRRPVFFGDDTTDEDVFAVLPEFGGLGISVGKCLPGANFAVHSPDEVRRWLAHLVAQEDHRG
jgi:trehalose 6-phosphate phosphatase